MNQTSINGYTRRFVYSISRKLPKVKRVTSQRITYVKQIPSDVVNIFESDVIPPETDLLQWRNRLRNMGNLALETPIVESDHGTFTFETVESALQLIKAKGVQESAMQEIHWFQTSELQPQSISQYPTTASIKQFQKLIMDFPHKQELPSIGITLDELSRLCHKRYLSGDHVHYFISRLNNLNKENLCIYLNRISDVDKYMGNLLKKQIAPKSLSFITNVGMDQRGRIFIGSDCRPGNHWTFAHYDIEENILLYGDSLGWQIPDN